MSYDIEGRGSQYVQHDMMVSWWQSLPIQAAAMHEEDVQPHLVISFEERDRGFCKVEKATRGIEVILLWYPAG